MKSFLSTLVVLAILRGISATPAQQQPTERTTLLRPARVFDGTDMHEGWTVRVRGDRIEAAGPAAVAGPADATIDMPGVTLLPGLVEGHSHVLLHPYNETSWNDQVLREGLALRAARATNHLRVTLMAGCATSGPRAQRTRTSS
jgi:imidazolonepropionase-like amidohydrolase